MTSLIRASARLIVKRASEAQSVGFDMSVRPRRYDPDRRPQDKAATPVADPRCCLALLPPQLVEFVHGHDRHPEHDP